MELAVFVRQTGEQSQFYTMSGNWIQRISQEVKFFVPGFMDPKELEPLLPFLPEIDVSEMLQNKMQSFESAPPRDVSSRLLKKMLKFWKKSDAVYRAASFELDNAHKLLAYPKSFRYATLHEIAQALLAENLMEGGEYPPEVLYALHRSLMQDEVRFRPQRVGSHRTWGQFEISSTEEVVNIEFVTKQVRRYQESMISASRGSPSSRHIYITTFIKKAQGLIDESRKTRSYTTHGVISPLRSQNGVQRKFPILVGARKGVCCLLIPLYFLRIQEPWGKLSQGIEQLGKD